MIVDKRGAQAVGSRLNRLVASVLLVAIVSPSYAEVFQPAAGWVPIQGGTVDGALEIPAGTILDFSSIVQRPAITSESQRLILNSQGKFVRQGEPTKPLKFLITGMEFGVAYGKFPTKDKISRLVVQYKRHGYNMVRLHGLDYVLMQDQPNDLTYSSEQLDRLHFLISELKSNGIYVILDTINSANASYGDNSIGGPNGVCTKSTYYSWDRYLGVCDVTGKIYYDAAAQQHWKNQVVAMLGAVNPYTGVSLLDDPVVAGVALTNENTLMRRLNTAWLKALFNQWLLTKYGSTSALQTAWGVDDPQNNPVDERLQPTETLESGTVNISGWNSKISKRMTDSLQFVYEAEKNNADWMGAYMHQVGYKGFITSYNDWDRLVEHMGRKNLQWVDMHAYFAHPTDFVNIGSQVIQSSMLGSKASHITLLAGTKHFGKPFTVSEHGQVFWNKYRYEAALATPAYAALQSWDAISHFNNSVVLNYLDYTVDTSKRMHAIYPFGVGADPIGRSTETLAALLYLRGDVTPANSQVGLKFNANNVYSGSYQGGLGSDEFWLSLVTGFSLDFDGAAAAKKATDATLPFHAQVNYADYGKLNFYGRASSPTLYSATVRESTKWPPTYSVAEYLEELRRNRWVARVQNLRDAGIISSTNLTNGDTGVFQSDTGQIYLDSSKNFMRVITPKTVGVAFDGPVLDSSPIVIGDLLTLSSAGSAMVAVSSLDTDNTRTINNSRRMLVVLATDAQNSDMTFSDSAATTLANLGHEPVLVKPVKVKLTLKNTNSATLKVWSTDLRGVRKTLIPVTRTTAGIQFELDISTLSHGATNYFEINIS